MSVDPEIPSLGPCCICESTDSVVIITLLDFRSPIPGFGWGCVICNRSCDGAVAVTCTACLGKLGDPTRRLRFACRGNPATDGRVLIGDLTEPFGHDYAIDHDAADWPISV